MHFFRCPCVIYINDINTLLPYIYLTLLCPSTPSMPKQLASASVLFIVSFVINITMWHPYSYVTCSCYVHVNRMYTLLPTMNSPGFCLFVPHCWTILCSPIARDGHLAWSVMSVIYIIVLCLDINCGQRQKTKCLPPRHQQRPLLCHSQQSQACLPARNMTVRPVWPDSFAC